MKVNERNTRYMYFYSIIGERNQDGILLKNCRVTVYYDLQLLIFIIKLTLKIVRVEY